MEICNPNVWRKPITRTKKPFLGSPTYINKLYEKGQGDFSSSLTRHKLSDVKKELYAASRVYYFVKQAVNKPVEMKFDVKTRIRHLDRIKYSSKAIDNDAPRMRAKIPRTERAAFRLDDILQENKMLLRRICTIWRTKGVTDSSCPKVYRFSNFRQRLNDSLSIDERNKLLVYFIHKAYPIVPTRKQCGNQYQQAVDQMKFICHFPLVFTDTTKIDHPLPMLNPPPVDCRAPFRKRVFMDFITSTERFLGRVEIEMFEEEAPKCTSNFLAYIRGHAKTTEDGQDHILTYRDSPLHCIVPGYYCLGGDVTNHDGTGGASIYEDGLLDEKNKLQHCEPGLLCTTGSNDSKFMITLKTLPVMNERSTIFGRVVKGFEVLCAVNYMGAKVSGKPITDVYCCDCGEIKRRKKRTHRKQNKNAKKEKQEKNEQSSKKSSAF